MGVTLDSFTIFGNGSNITFNNAAFHINHKFLSCTLNGDSTFSSTNGITVSGSAVAFTEIIFENCDFGVAGGIKTAHTNDINIATANMVVSITLRNCRLASPTELSGQASIYPYGFIKSQKHDSTTANHKSWFKYGTITIETSTVHTGGTAFKMTPNDASNKLESGSFFVAVANGATLTPSVYVNEDASYNGARARLIVKKNVALGITSDTVLDTATAASDGAWEQLTGTTAAVTDDGVCEFVVDVDGTAGNVFVDSFTCS